MPALSLRTWMTLERVTWVRFLCTMIMPALREYCHASTFRRGKAVLAFEATQYTWNGTAGNFCLKETWPNGSRSSPLIFRCGVGYRSAPNSIQMDHGYWNTPSRPDAEELRAHPVAAGTTPQCEFME